MPATSASEDKRAVGPFRVTPIGLGCMGLSHAYGYPPTREDAVDFLNRALDLGYDFLDTAAVYGFGGNEELIGKAISHRRDEFVLASKCGLLGGKDSRVIDGRPETLLRTLDEALVRLRTDVIDLYYLHRWDKSVPLEESVGALGRMVESGKVRAIGLSEVSAAMIRKAHAVHPITAVQNEYSPWTRNVELGVLNTTRELGIALVAFSPVGRGFLAGAVRGSGDLPEGDFRRGMPRFQGENLAHNLRLLGQFETIGDELGCTPAQLALAWVLSRADHVVAIPGTTSRAHAEENLQALAVQLPQEAITRIETILGPHSIAGGRYSEAMQASVDTEEFPPD